MDTTTDRLREIAHKMLVDAATEEEKAFFLESLAGSDERAFRQVLFPEEDWIRQPGGPLPATVREKMLNAIYSVERPVPGSAGLLRRWRSRKYKWYAAASVLVLVCSSILLKKWRQKAAPIAYLEKVSLPGQRSLIELPDGSRIYLNAGSRLKYPEKYAELSREVFLEGEAFFDVKKNTRLPFIVHTGPLSTRVLGTSFDVRNYTDDPDMSVTVKDGKVSVSYKAGGRDTAFCSAILLPDQQVSIEKNSPVAALSVETIEGEDIGSWTSNRLVFRKAALSHILHTLERTYGIRFHVSDPELLKCVYTLKFDNLPLQDVLDNLRTVAGLRIQSRGKEFTINGLHCQ